MTAVPQARPAPKPDRTVSRPGRSRPSWTASSSAKGTEQAEVLESQVPSLARVEWEHIQRVLADCQGNISQTAKLLGLHRRSLQRKLTKYPPRI